jgi:hypothetical protein
VTAKAWLDERSDGQVALLCAAVLFVLCAYPLLLVDVPPYQDVPNHLAVSTIINHPADYPEYIVTGFLKTNAAFYAWDHFVGDVIGARLAIRLFAAIVLAANALVFTRLLLVFGDRKKLLVGSLFLAPMVHNWCIALGLLDFALAVPLALSILIVMKSQRVTPTPWRAGLIALLSCVTWYAHIMALFMAHVLVGIELVLTFLRSRDEAKKLLVRCVVPMLPGTMLALWSVGVQALAPAAIKLAGYHPSTWLPPWDLAYNLWAEWFWAFTYLSLPSTFIPCVVLAILAWMRRKERMDFFSPCAFLALGLMYSFVPYVWSYWAYANTRVEPFLWFAALLRVPPKLPKWLIYPLGACTVAYSASLGVDYVRLDREQKEFTAGIPYVPEHAKLLPMVFTSKGVAVNTHPLGHTWGFYVLEKQTTAPRVFASSRMFGVTYREAPNPQVEHIALERFVGVMRTPFWLCQKLSGDLGINVGDCVASWREYWREFWDVLAPRYDWLLLWDPAPITETIIPAEYKVIFRQGRLTIMHRPESKPTAGRVEP